MEWKRPESIPYPKIWSKFDGKRKINDTIPKFWIQDVTEDMVDEIVAKMLIGFVQEEPLCRYSKIIEDEASVAEGTELYKYLLRNKLSCVCMSENTKKEPIIAGVSCLQRVTKNDPKFQFRGVTHARVRSITGYVYNLKSPYSFFGVDEYLSDRGIYIYPEFRGQGICMEFLKCWPIICKSIGLKVVAGTFTSKFSQSAAERVGYNELLSIPYVELGRVNPQYHLPGIEEHTTNLKILYTVP